MELLQLMSLSQNNFLSINYNKSIKEKILLFCKSINQGPSIGIFNNCDDIFYIHNHAKLTTKYLKIYRALHEELFINTD